MGGGATHKYIRPKRRGAAGIQAYMGGPKPEDAPKPEEAKAEDATNTTGAINDVVTAAEPTATADDAPKDGGTYPLDDEPW